MKKFINDYYDKAIELKKMFQITENKKWNQFTVLAELNYYRIIKNTVN